MRAEQAEFNFQKARQEREAGLQQASSNRAEVLAVARYLAAQVATSRPEREITADDVQRALLRRGYAAEDLGNAAGAIFRGEEWEFTGEWKRSERVSNHGHLNRVWRYVG